MYSSKVAILPIISFLFVQTLKTLNWNWTKIHRFKRTLFLPVPPKYSGSFPLPTQDQDSACAPGCWINPSVVETQCIVEIFHSHLSRIRIRSTKTAKPVHVDYQSKSPYDRDSDPRLARVLSAPVENRSLIAQETDDWQLLASEQQSSAAVAS